MVYMFLGTDDGFACKTDKEYKETPKLFDMPFNLSVTDENWEAGRGAVRRMNNKYVFGYNAEEEKWLEAKDKADAAHKYLAETDYVACKIAEGAATREEYKDVLERREQMRDVINDFDSKTKPATLSTPTLKLKMIPDNSLNTNPFPPIPAMPEEVKEAVEEAMKLPYTEEAK